MNKTLFYQDRPLFGLDIGHRTVKVMQIDNNGHKHTVSGYGITAFDEKAVENGVIVDYDKVAGSINQLFSSGLTGEISTRRAAVSVPASRTFSRILTLPTLDKKDIHDAVMLESEQYIPVPISELYIDYMVVNQGPKDMSVLAVAVPKKIIDSYINLCSILDLDPVVMETTTGATNRLFRYTDQHLVPTVLIDFGAVATDVSIYDKHLAVTGTVPVGGDHITSAISEALGVTAEEAQTIKIRYGLSLSKKQSEIIKAVEPVLERTIKEVRHMIRYYEERSDSKRRIEQIVTFGGASNMPGLSDFLIDRLRLPVRACDPWDQIVFRHLDPPSPVEQPLYITVASLALIRPGEAFS